MHTKKHRTKQKTASTKGFSLAGDFRRTTLAMALSTTIGLVTPVAGWAASSEATLTAQATATERQAAQANLANEMAIWEFAAQKWASDSLYPYLQKQGVSTQKAPFPPVLLYDGNESLCAAGSIAGGHVVAFNGTTQTSDGSSHFLPTNFTPPYQGAYCAIVYGGLGKATVNGTSYPGADVFAYFVPGEQDSHSVLLKNLPAASAALDISQGNEKYHAQNNAMPIWQGAQAGADWKLFGKYAGQTAGVSLPTTGSFWSGATQTVTSSGSAYTVEGNAVLNDAHQVVGDYLDGNITFMPSSGSTSSGAQ